MHTYFPIEKSTCSSIFIIKQLTPCTGYAFEGFLTIFINEFLFNLLELLSLQVLGPNKDFYVGYARELINTNQVRLSGTNNIIILTSQMLTRSKISSLAEFWLQMAV